MTLLMVIDDSLLEIAYLVNRTINQFSLTIYFSLHY